MLFYVYRSPVMQRNIFYYNFYLYGQWTSLHQAAPTSLLCMLQALLVQWESKASMTKWDDGRSYGLWLDDLLEVVEPLSCGTYQSLCRGLQQVALVYFQELKYMNDFYYFPYFKRNCILTGSSCLCVWAHVCVHSP